MNRPIESILDELEQKFTCVQMDFQDPSWREGIPSEAGWYMIKTNTPIAVLRSVGLPKYKAHTNIPGTLDNTSLLQDTGIAIIQTDDEDCVVYNGEAKNLRARAREHDNGHSKTYCLGLSNYEALRGYRWIFCYVAMSDCEGLGDGDKLLRLAVEQAWRAKNGWPILCRK